MFKFISKEASVTLTLAQWNHVFCALYDAREYALSKGYTQTAADLRALQEMIQQQGGLEQSVRQAYLAEFPEEMAPVMAATDEAIERKAERDATGVYETPSERADRSLLKSERTGYDLEF